MRGHGRGWLPVTLISLALAGGFAMAAKQKQEAPSRAAEARALYGEGRYGEARPLLEEIAAQGQASGTLLYRLAYCRRHAGDSAAAEEAEAKARAALEQEFASAREVEVPFYLVNAYQNQKRDEDARRVAAEATERVEQGDMPRPSDRDGWFQLGKLYADQGREEPAAEWYAKAVEAHAGAAPEAGSYLLRASRFLAERALRLGDFAAAQRHYTTLTEGGEGSPADWERLATARTRVGMYDEAAVAWGRAAEGARDPNRAHYCAGITRQAGGLGGLPAAPPSGKAWTEQSQAELEAAMQEQADIAKRILTEVAQAETIGPDERERFKASLREPRGLLLAAALEYALRGHGIREVSFFGGYAPLLMKARAWRVPLKPTPPEPAGS